jgi:mannose-6-phosphate isomerase-like protein (cupin superfamily)
MRRVVVLGIVLAVAACHGESTGPVAGPPLAITLPTPAPPPPDGAFRELTASGVPLPFGACREVVVVALTGTAAVGEERLAAGDVLAVRGLPEQDAPLTGQGLALVVTAPDSGCVTRSRVVRAGRAPDLSFMGGAMHAQLDIDDRDVASFYLGRLWGTAGVPEHAHDKSWEILCAVEAAGTFTSDGKQSPLAPRTCVAMPPGTKHSWTPDPGSNLVAVQMYAPPGPEQRFKKLAAEEAVRDR